MINKESYRHFKISAFFSLCLAMLIACFVSYYGKNTSFLIINKFNSPAYDYFFEYFTYLGDGILWIPLLLYVSLYKKDFLIVVLFAFLISTVLTQFCKWILFADALRPIGILHNQVRTISGLTVHKTSSFPSGHTTTAFTFALLLSYLFKRKFWTFFFPVIAFFVGYSRVYLAQHFVTDVLGGLLVGITSAYLSLLFYKALKKNKSMKKDIYL